VSRRPTRGSVLDVPGVAPLDEDDPRELGPYILLGRLGDGGMGSVYLARRPPGASGSGSGSDEQALVAVKVIRPDLARLPQFRERFLREAEAARRVARFCTAEVLDVNTTGRPYLVTEYVDGPTLLAAVRDRGPMPAAELERLGIAVASALTAIHAAGVVHRDLKPANILLSPSGARVIDFGIARAYDTTTGLTEGSIGTPAYMAPEQALGAQASAAADIHAWGAVLLFAATGRSPFGEGATPAVLLRRVVDETPDLRGVPEPLRPIVAQALAKDPAQRPTAQDLLLQLHHLHLEPGQVPAAPSASPQIALDPLAATGTAGAAVAVDPATAHRWPQPGAFDSQTDTPTTASQPRDHSAAAPPAAGQLGHWPPVGRSRPATRRWPSGPRALTAVAVLAALLVVLRVVIFTTRSDRSPGTARESTGPSGPSTTPPREGSTGEPGAGGSATPAAGADGTTAEVLERTPPRRLGSPLTGHTGYIRAIAFAPDGHTLATASQDRIVRLWDVTDPARPKGYDQPLIGHTDEVRGLSYSADGRLLATGSEDMTARLWDVRDPASPRRLGVTPPAGDDEGLPTVVNDVALSPDGRLLAVVVQDLYASLRFYDVTDPNSPRQIGEPHEISVGGIPESVEKLRFAPDGGLLVGGDEGGNLHFWDVTNPARPADLTVPLSAADVDVTGLAVSTDGRTLASSGLGGEVRLWDLSDPRNVRPFGQPVADYEDNVNGVAFSPDGTVLASGSAGDDLVRLADVTDKAAPKPIDGPLENRLFVFAVAFSPDGRVLASGGSDSEITLWKLR